MDFGLSKMSKLNFYMQSLEKNNIYIIYFFLFFMGNNNIWAAESDLMMPVNK